MLTINADKHPLMNLFHKPIDEKRMVVILEPEQFGGWLQAPASRSIEFLRPFPAEALRVG
jgi:putative SOS response-associated peptidase YedK